MNTCFTAEFSFPDVIFSVKINNGSFLRSVSGNACWKFSKELLRITMILFCGLGFKLFSPQF